MTKSAVVIAALVSICLCISPCPAAPKKIKPAERQALAQHVIAEFLLLNDEIVKTTTAYKDHLLMVLEGQQLELERLTREADSQQEWLRQGLISRQEFEENGLALAKAKYSIKITKRRIDSAEQMIASTQAETNGALMQLESREPGNRTRATGAPYPPGGSGHNDTVTRYDGNGPWLLADSRKIEHFFSSRFGHSLPVSAWGETDLHQKMNLDHRNAMDVALHPDSAEGEALINYLRDAGIPHLAFRGRVAGKSTGAHIHIGKPSLRLASP